MTTSRPPGKTGLRRFIGPKRIMILTVLAVLVGIAWYLRRQGWLDPSAIQHLIEQYPVTAPIVFALIYGLAMLSAFVRDDDDTQWSVAVLLLCLSFGYAGLSGAWMALGAACALALPVRTSPAGGTTACRAPPRAASPRTCR